VVTFLFLSVSHRISLVFSVPTIAQAVLKLKNSDSPREVLDGCPYLQDFLDRFYTSRIAIRALISHHIEIHRQTPGMVGIIGEHVNVREIVKGAVEDASSKCQQAYGVQVDVEIIGGEDMTIKYIPSHLHHIMFELLKNSMRALVEHPDFDEFEHYPIEVGKLPISFVRCLTCFPFPFPISS